MHNHCSISPCRQWSRPTSARCSHWVPTTSSSRSFENYVIIYYIQARFFFFFFFDILQSSTILLNNFYSADAYQRRNIAQGWRQLGLDRSPLRAHWRDLCAVRSYHWLRLSERAAFSDTARARLNATNTSKCWCFYMISNFITLALCINLPCLCRLIYYRLSTNRSKKWLHWLLTLPIWGRRGVKWSPSILCSNIKPQQAKTTKKYNTSVLF